MSTEPVENFILSSEDNLKIAAAVADAWPQARKILVTDFLKRLEAAWGKKLKGWNCRIDGNFFTDPYADFLFWKPQWEEQYCVTLECHDYGNGMMFGLTRDEDQIKGRPFSSELLAAISTAFPSARSRTWWEANIKMQTPAKDWRKPEVLWRMRTDDKFLSEVVGQLLEVAKISEPIVDKLARKK